MSIAMMGNNQKLIVSYNTILTAGKLIMCRVNGIAHRKPRGEELDNADPVRNDESGLWQCPFCRKNDFAELSDVSLKHFSRRLIRLNLVITIFLVRINIMMYSF